MRKVRISCTTEPSERVQGSVRPAVLVTAQARVGSGLADSTPPACTEFGAIIVLAILGACPEAVVSLLALHFALECWTEDGAACQSLVCSAVSAPQWSMSDPFQLAGTVPVDVLRLVEAFVLQAPTR